ncbi:MAG: hypothetical protein R6X15_09780 [Pseudomonadota bacterium]
MSNGENEFIEKARLNLEQRLERTPAHVSSRLHAARRRALDSRRRKQPLWLPAMATAALVAVIGAGVWFGYSAQQTAPVPKLAAVEEVPHVNDFEMLARDDDLELYEDLDFYLWLERQEPDAV